MIDQKDASFLRDTVKRFVEAVPCPDTYQINAEFEHDIQSDVWRLVLDAYPSVMYSDFAALVHEDPVLHNSDIACVAMESIKLCDDNKEFVKKLDESMQRCVEKIRPMVVGLDAKYGEQLRVLQAKIDAKLEKVA